MAIAVQGVGGVVASSTEVVETAVANKMLCPRPIDSVTKAGSPLSKANAIRESSVDGDNCTNRQTGVVSKPLRS